LAISSWCLTSTDSATSARAAGTGESGNGRQQVQKPDEQIAHRWIRPRS
jgi:hypothetical protein